MPVSLLDEILEYSGEFVRTKQYEPYRTSGLPSKRMVIVACMDTRLVELLPKAMNVKNGDAIVVKSAGAMVTDPFGDVMRSILVALYELQAEEVFVVGHHGCGMNRINPSTTLSTMKQRGISEETIRVLQNGGIDIHTWLQGFHDVTNSVRQSVDVIQKHPLLPPSTPVHGMIIHPETGELEVVVRGY
jgi:carbonic anhydrase